LKDNDRSVSIPHFNRETDSVVDDQDQVNSEDHILIIEGNYLLLKTEPWSQLKEYFDLAVSINPGIEALRQRLVQRWLDNGHTHEQAEQRALSNDIPNAHTVLNNSSAPDISLK
jgi:pantothenate kinase